MPILYLSYNFQKCHVYREKIWPIGPAHPQGKKIKIKAIKI
jgi:hypothetical protein